MTSKTINSDELRKVIENFTQEIGCQVTRDYVFRGGIWEGLSISNVQSIDKVVKRLGKIFQPDKSELNKRLSRKDKGVGKKLLKQ